MASLEEGSTKQQAATLFVFIALISGLGFTAMQMMCCFLGVPFPSCGTFYAVQPRIIERVVALALMSCAGFAQFAGPATVFSFDGSWNHPRWGTKCLSTFIDLDQRKIVDFDIREREGKGLKQGGNHDGPPQTMEAAGFAVMRDRWRGRGTPIRAVAHDQDARVSRLMQELDWRVQEIHDINHVAASFEALWKKFAMVMAPGAKRRHRVLNDAVSVSIHKHWRYCAEMEGTLAEKKEKWNEAVDHCEEAGTLDTDDDEAVAAARELDQGGRAAL
jgi:hypothetical protein